MPLCHLPHQEVVRRPIVAAASLVNRILGWFIDVVLPPRFRNIVFEITATDVGVFEVTGRFLGRQIEKVELVFQVKVDLYKYITCR